VEDYTRRAAEVCKNAYKGWVIERLVGQLRDVSLAETAAKGGLGRGLWGSQNLAEFCPAEPEASPHAGCKFESRANSLGGGGDW
jgi:hypothetical protein